MRRREIDGKAAEEGFCIIEGAHRAGGIDGGLPGLKLSLTVVELVETAFGRLSYGTQRVRCLAVLRQQALADLIPLFLAVLLIR